MKFSRILFLLFLFLPGTAGAAPQTTVGLTTRLEGFGIQRNRVVLSWGACRFLMIDVRREGQPQRHDYGLALPGFFIGPCNPRGLLKLIEKPLAYGVSSSVPGEKTALRFSTSLDSGSRTGFSMTFFEGLWGYYYSEKDQYHHIGGGLQLGRVFLLADYTAGQIPPTDEIAGSAGGGIIPDWYLLQHGYDEDEILRIAVRVILSGFPFDLDLCSGLSASRMRPPGFFLVLPLECTWKGISLRGIAGYLSGDYLVHGGSSPARRFRLGWRILREWESGSIAAGTRSLEYSCLLKYPEEFSASRLPREDKLELELRRRRIGGPAELKVQCQVKRTLPGSGPPVYDRELGLEMDLEDRFGIRWHLDEKALKRIPQVRLNSGSGSRGFGEFEVWAAGDFLFGSLGIRLDEVPAVEAELGVVFPLKTAHDGVLTAELETVKPIPMEGARASPLRMSDYLRFSVRWRIVTVPERSLPSRSRG